MKGFLKRLGLLLLVAIFLYSGKEIWTHYDTYRATENEHSELLAQALIESDSK